MAQAFCKTVRKTEVFRQVAPNHLHINGGWQTEVQDFGCQIPRQEGELRARELHVEVMAQKPPIFRHRGCRIFKRNRNIAILRTHSWRWNISLIQWAEWQAAVINQPFHLPR